MEHKDIKSVQILGKIVSTKFKVTVKMNAVVEADILKEKHCFALRL